MRRRPPPGRILLPAAGLLLAGVGLLAGVSLLTAPVASAAPPALGSQDGSLIMVLDSSGSMAGPDGSGHTRIQSARTAVGSVVDSLPDGYPAGLRVYGAGKTHGCNDTSLAQPVTALDRAAMKQAVAAVQPKGDTPTALALTKAAADLPAQGRRTILLVSDGESNCGAPKPCEVAATLAGDGLNLRIDTVGFQVEGAARDELECIAKAGHGAYYDAPDAAALGRQLVRASQLSADAYRMAGDPVTGGATPAKAAAIGPGQYTDTIGPGETRWYAATLDAASTADLSATAVPQPGVPVGYGDGIELKLAGTGTYGYTCDSDSEHFGQDEGAMTLTAAVSRVPSRDGKDDCDTAGRYLFSVHRTTAAASDRSRWPVELRFDKEAPLPAGTVAAAARTDYGTAPAPLTGTPKDLTGGTGFNDAAAVTKGVWRDRLLPGQTRYYKVHLGWGQQLTYAAEFANEPVLDGASSAASTFVATTAYAPGRLPVEDASDARDNRSYTGSPVSVGLGTVPVTWTNRWVDDGDAATVHSAGDYWIAVGLGPDAAQLARNTAVGVILRVNVTGTELAGPQYQAPALASHSGAAQGDAANGGTKGGQDAAGGQSGNGQDAASSASSGGGLRSMDLVAAGTGGAVALAAIGVAALVHRLRSRTTRGGA
ncbi:vWA domain-containing protein [Streptomyces sp. NBC_01477]|uniref:vWA domain-containing protein n=1 Tax=Streptomyces sp. NBC_01477 TaxID=2976015 RepID=UPI002E37AD15|nr:VWA domain-containing protein [Streptomyces sp. NBC_01477]